ncbi:MAG TPA: hypothetical protein VMT69_08400 [Kineosporiaceae bacterium]|nr:hypothetical protein [Kineosporiaceae bacterium]
MTRLRFGVLLVVLSWVPIAQAVISISQHYGYLTTGNSADLVRLSIWGIQVLVGFVGLWLAGSVAVESARADGWRRVPGTVWRLFRDGGGEKAAALTEAADRTSQR